MLDDVQLQHRWNEQCIDAKDIQTASTTLYSRYDNLWFQNINDVVMNPKLRTYCTFKSCFEMEPYLMSILDFNIRKQITRFRVSNHVLCIEKGRHTKPKTPVEMHLCTVCNLNKIEDEHHFLIVYPLYSELREVFKEKMKDMGFYGDDFILPDILQNVDMSFSLGKLLIKMFKKREETLMLKN